MAAFTGIPVAALDFYEDLEADNSKTWWAAHKETYDEVVRRPMASLTAAVGGRIRHGQALSAVS